ncbi:SUMO-activating enzyme subunit 1-like isoform X2 [Myxocyprinus asiaticus]|uniref:SUMO-activating enzyme subunit 1-like isoform X2 n=1 Tax=Myxocyprinus asiaticus TaxID=70543 RepID=UPI002221DAD3|nr:SUMO-activating enzyme subunit 1-like isoform X2 [Myxocyprinus asiaticus]
MIDTIEKEDNIISEEEAAQYDRQIRLWGLDAQKRLRASRVLLVGLRGLGAEVAKNLILAGVKGLTFLDHQQVTEESRRTQFLIPVDADGQNQAQASLERAQSLNPMVEVKADTEPVESKPDDFFFQFDAICMTGCSKDLMVRVDQLCTSRNIKIFCGDVFGYHGYMFSNLGLEHHYVEEKPKVVKASDEANDGPEAKKPKIDPNETTMVKKTVSFCSLKEALEVDWTNEKAKSCLKRVPTDYFLLQGAVSERCSSQELLLLRRPKGQRVGGLLWIQISDPWRTQRDECTRCVGLYVCSQNTMEFVFCQWPQASKSVFGLYLCIAVCCTLIDARSN